MKLVVVDDDYLLCTLRHTEEDHVTIERVLAIDEEIGPVRGRLNTLGIRGNVQGEG